MKDKLLHIKKPVFKSKILNHDAHLAFTTKALMQKLLCRITIITCSLYFSWLYPKASKLWYRISHLWCISLVCVCFVERWWYWDVSSSYSGGLWWRIMFQWPERWFTKRQNDYLIVFPCMMMKLKCHFISLHPVGLTLCSCCMLPGKRGWNMSGVDEFSLEHLYE